MRRVLLAEDEPDLRELTALLLSRHGCEVVAVGDGGEAAALLEGGDRFDVLVLDQGMPVLTGTEVAARARTAGHRGPVVLWTGWAGGVPARDVESLDLLLLAKHDALDLVEVVTAHLAGSGSASGPGPAEPSMAFPAD